MVEVEEEEEDASGEEVEGGELAQELEESHGVGGEVHLQQGEQGHYLDPIDHPPQRRHRRVHEDVRENALREDTCDCQIHCATH